MAYSKWLARLVFSGWMQSISGLAWDLSALRPARFSMAKPAPQLDVEAVASTVAVILVAASVINALLRFVLRAVASVLRWNRQAFVLRNAPMAPGYLPLIGHTITLFKAVGNYPCTWDLFARWATASAPKPVRVQIFTRHCVVIADPSMMKRVMSSNLKNYAKDLEFSYAPFLEILGTGLVTSGGDTWRKMRGHISKALRVEILDEIIAIATRAVERLCSKLDAIKGSGESVDMENEFRLLTLQVIGEAILSLSPEESDELFLPLPSHHGRMQPPQSQPVALVPSDPRVVRASSPGAPAGRRHRGYHPREVAEKNSRRERSRRHLGTRAGPGGRQRIRRGGGDAAVLRDQDVLARRARDLRCDAHVDPLRARQQRRRHGRVKSEADRVFGKLKRDALPTRDSLASLEYSVAALKETLRLYSVVPVVTRVAVEDDDLGGVRVPAGTTVIMSLQGVHHRDDIWPDPLAYKPERFLDADENEGFKFLPFIQGPRNCLGQYLALLEARVVLCSLVKRYRFEHASGENGKKHTKAIPIAPAHGMHFTVS